MNLQELIDWNHRRRHGGRPSRAFGDGARQDGRPGGNLPPHSLALVRAALAWKWLLAAAAAALLLLLVVGIWISVLLLGYVGEHGVKGLLEAVLGAGARLWEGRG